MELLIEGLIFVKHALLESWSFLKEASFFFVIGLFLAGLIRLFLSTEYITAHLGTKGIGSIFKAAFLGIPLPLCSCSVLPVAASLKKQGANKGAISAFLISTPESGIDSIVISWALLDPILTVARPIAAFVSAVFTGIIENFLTNDDTSNQDITEKCSCNNHCSSSINEESKCSCNSTKQDASFMAKFFQSLNYAFLDLWYDIAPWFFAGVMLAGLISALLPDFVFQDYLGGGISAMILMLVLGIPVYICASASTPIAAAMIMKGISPGTALVFLLVGPATNVTSLSVLYRILGKKGTFAYLISIAVFSIIAGLIVDAVYLYLGISANSIIGKAAQVIPSELSVISALSLILIFFYVWLKGVFRNKIIN